MAWEPDYSIVTARALPDNLLAYMLDDDRQTDALTWAGGTNLKLIKSFSISNAARDRPIYPLILIRDDDDEQELGLDHIGAAYTVNFTVQVQDSDPDQAVTNARIYAKALCSMIANCSQSTLTTNTGAVVVTLQSILTAFEPIKTNDVRNDFLQTINIRLGYTLEAGSYL